MTCTLAPQRRSAAPDDVTTAVVEPQDVGGVGTPTTWHPPLGGILGRASGWTLVVVGVVLMPLPGPGTLVVVAGLRVLVPYHRWAAASYDRVRDRAVAAARAGVATRTRVAASLAGVGWVALLAGAYAVDVSIPRISVLGLGIGPDLPFHGTATTIGLVVSALASAGATLYSIARLRPLRLPAAT